MVARDDTPAGHRLERRRLGAAPLGRQQTARGERAAVGALSGRGHRPGDAFQLCQAVIQRRVGGEQSRRVRVHGRIQHDPRRSALRDRAGVEHDDLVGAAAHHAEVVRDQDQAEPAPLLQLGEHGEDLALGGGVERRRRLVRDEHIRVAGDRCGDRDPLPHAAGQLVQLMRVASRDGRVQPHLPQSVLDDGANRRARHPRAATTGERAHGVGDLGAAAVHRAERGERVLEQQ